MQKCTSCGVNLTGNRDRCPLCGHKLEGFDESAGESYGLFPKVPVRVSYPFILKINAFAALAVLLVANLLHYAFFPDFPAYVPLSLGAVCAWIAVNVGFRCRKDLARCVCREGVLAILLCLIWDALTGWRGWSVNFVLPSVSLAMVVFFCVMGIVDRRRLTVYADYFMVGELGIAACAVLLFLGVFSGIGRFFAVSAVGAGVLLLIAQIVFRTEEFVSELGRWIHL